MRDRRIKFRHIEGFVEICREGRFKAAAEKLFVTQPAMSKTLKELEEIVGTPLLTRNRGGVSLTEAGAVFLRHAEMALANLRHGLDAVAGAEAMGQDRVTIGVLPSVAARLIPRVAERFRVAAPDTMLRIVDGPLSYLTDRLKAGDLDLVIGRMADHAQMAGLSFSGLYRERISFVVRPGHPLLAAPRLQDVAQWPVLYPSPGSAIRPIIERYLIETGIGDLPRRIETVSGAFGRVHTRATDAVWIISDGVVANEIAQGLLARLPFDTDTMLGPIGITTLADRDWPPAARGFQRVLSQVVAEMPDLPA